MRKGFKKAITLVEMIVSVAIIALISITFLGIIVPAMNMHKRASEIDQSTYNAADEIEKKIYSMQDGNSNLSDGTVESNGDYNLTFKIGGDTYTCDGTLFTSTDGDVKIKAFVPDKAAE